jgi:hypothetical protein
VATVTARIDLPLTAGTVTDARMLTLTTARAWGSQVSLESLVLLVDGLTAAVTAHSALEHGLVLELTATGSDRLRVGLLDHTAVRPVTRHLSAGELAELDGLAEVAVLATTWGHEPHQHGHRIWFELLKPPDLDDLDDLALDIAAGPPLPSLGAEHRRADPASRAPDAGATEEPHTSSPTPSASLPANVEDALRRRLTINRPEEGSATQE